MLIYKVTNNINGQIYIGQTTLSLEQRKYKHEQESRSKYRKTVKFHNALLKYGFSNFTWEILKECNYQYYGARKIEKVIQNKLENIIIDNIINNNNDIYIDSIFSK